jgi:NAD(P)-dependent dehydrogenase (short-subunit alcohol dehydrogenase family)
MTGVVLLTGANGSLAIPTTKYLLSTYPMFTLVLTVRDDSDEDTNTAELRRIVVRYPKVNVIIRKLDLASLEEVQSFSHVLRLEIESGRLPRIVAIICNAFTWKLSGGAAYSKEGYETSIAVNHLAHFALSLRLLSSMNSQRGRIVFLGSEAHWPDRAGLSKGYPTKLPENLDLLVHPEPDQRSQEMGRGFQRYGMSKLIITIVMYELNRRLKTVCNRHFSLMKFSNK